MATAFRRQRGALVAVLEQGEAQLLDTLLADVERLLAPAGAGQTRPPDPLAVQLGLADLDLDGADVDAPDDPAVARLLPAGTTDDDALAADYRRLTQPGLRRRKVDNLRTARATLAGAAAGGDPDAPLRLRLDRAQGQAWVVALTDLRLVLADRLGIRTDEDATALHDRLAQAARRAERGGADGRADPDEDARASWLSMVYDFVSWVQESLTEVLAHDLPAAGDGRRLPPPV